MKYFFLIIIMFSLFTSRTKAENSGRKNFSIFAGTGLAYTLPGPIRLRVYEAEVGTFGPSLGVVKFMPFGARTYGLLGGALAVAGEVDFGFVAALGWEYLFFWNFGIRAEAFTLYTIRNYSYPGLTLGLSFSF